MIYKVDFELEGIIEVSSESEEEAQQIVENMERHELLEEAYEIRFVAFASEFDEEDW